MRVEKTINNLRKCKCVLCPSFTTECKVKAIGQDVEKLVTGLGKAKHFEGMFCAFEKSECIHDHKGCKCKECEIEKEYGLERVYYCTGSETVEKAKKENKSCCPEKHKKA